ncbi:hypothetical protein H4R18_000458 [Coemansia javaensis]|uniref:CAP-Gly domain-containing protein n=1 Tax=Coemansia javaensis TaxID=2761396 RepID=A0A9W8HI35_9FUNG|nr:hypothetical protein H4R18_000458 [Coemansia javaensis]
MDESELVGRWFTVDGAGGIVRYAGPVEGSAGSWLGVEWEEAGRGKHDGRGGSSGRRYFECRFPQHRGTGLGGSFIRAVPRIDWGQSLLEAARERYGAGGNDEAAACLPRAIDGRRGRIEAVGMERVAQAQSNLRALAVVGVEGLRVSGAGDRAALGELAAATTLLLARNYLTDWAQVEQILAALPQRHLALVDVSANHIEAAQCAEPDGTTTVDTLRLDAAPLLGWAAAGRIAQQVRAQSLSLGRCALEDPGAMAEAAGLWPLRELHVRGNRLTTVRPFGALAGLETLDIGDNPLRTIDVGPPGAFGRLRSLDVTHTALDGWGAVDALRAVPSLRALALAHTPLAAGEPHARTQAVARLPQIAVLDRSEVSAAERTELERHYLVLCAAESAGGGGGGEAPLVDEMARRFPRVRELVAAHGAPARPSRVESRLRARVAGSTIEIVGAGDQAAAEVHARPLIRTMAVRQVRALAARLAGGRRIGALLVRAADGAAWVAMDNDARTLAFYGVDGACTVRAVVVGD